MYARNHDFAATWIQYDTKWIETLDMLTFAYVMIILFDICSRRWSNVIFSVPLWQCAIGSINQIPPHATVSGDCRVTPFYGIDAVKKSVEGYVAEINADPTILPSRGPFSKYVLPDEDRKGSLDLTWMGAGADGIACNLTSEGAKALNDATEKVGRLLSPYSY